MRKFNQREQAGEEPCFCRGRRQTSAGPSRQKVQKRCAKNEHHVVAAAFCRSVQFGTFADEQRRKIISAYLAAGVKRGELVLYFTDTTSPKEIHTWLKALQVHPYIVAQGQTVKNPFYLEPEEFFDEFKLEQ